MSQESESEYNSDSNSQLEWSEEGSNDDQIEGEGFSDLDSDLEDQTANLAPDFSQSIDKLKSTSLTQDDDEDKELNDLLTNSKKKSSTGFGSFGLSSNLLKSIQYKGYKLPTPIQRKTIPTILQGLDVVAMARTGSGKTAAFVIPLVEKLKAHKVQVGIRSLIFSPNRELAFQTAKVVKEMTKLTDLRSCAIVGGESIEDQFNLLAGNPDIVIVTPGRFLHLIVETDLDLKTIEYVVFDEADRLFEMGFDVQLTELLSRLPTSRQTLLFSATLPKNLIEFAKAGLQDPTLVRLDADTKISPDLEMAFFKVTPDTKEGCLLYLLRELVQCPLAYQVDRTPLPVQEPESKKKKSKVVIKPLYPKQAVIFVSTKHAVEYIGNLLLSFGYDCGMLYGSLDQTERQIQIDKFRNKQVPLFVVTDVAARGIDIPILAYVINYDFVDQSKVFIHRVGRAARAGQRGWAYSFVTDDELAYFIDLQLFLARQLITAQQTEQLSPKEREDLDYTQALVIGALADPEKLSSDLEWVTAKLFRSVDMAGLKKVAINGYKMFKKSRRATVAARASYQRAKELLRSGEMDSIHPLLSGRMESVEVQRSDLLKGIANFKPTETVFEVGLRGTKKATEASTTMKNRRLQLDTAIAKYRSQAPAHQPTRKPVLEKQDSVQDEELEQLFPTKTRLRSTAKDSNNYISYMQKDAHTEKGYSIQSGTFLEQAGNASLDLTGDDQDAKKRLQNQLRWDKKKKKYVKGDGTGSDNKKLLTTAAGNKLQASYKSGLYQEWAKKHKFELPTNGMNELEDSKRKLEDTFNKRKFKHHTKPDKAGGADGDARSNKKVKNELKSVHQIRKERDSKERRREKTGRHNKESTNNRNGGKGDHRNKGNNNGSNGKSSKGKPSKSHMSKTKLAFKSKGKGRF